MSPLEHIHTKSPAEERADAREKVAGAARAGRNIREIFSADDLDWAFDSRPEELAALDQLVQQKIEAQAAATLSADDRRALRREVERVIEEWDRAAQQERLQRAEVEARKRLGL